MARKVDTNRSEEDLDNVQRWTAKRRLALVLSITKGETSAKEAARKHGLTVAGGGMQALVAPTTTTLGFSTSYGLHVGLGH